MKICSRGLYVVFKHAVIMLFGYKAYIVFGLLKKFKLSGKEELWGMLNPESYDFTLEQLSGNSSDEYQIPKKK